MDCGWNSLFWDNHDLPRIVSRWGNDGKYRVESAKMLATVLHGMKGTPYIYQGEELGMTNVRFPDISHYRDIETLNMYRERKAAGYPEAEIMASLYAKSRDNARTPMQWDEGANAGFTEGTPWIEVNPNYPEINARAEMEDGDSIYHYYQKLIRLRKDLKIFVDGDFRLLLEEDPDIFAYERQAAGEKLRVIANFTEKTLPCSLLTACKEEAVLIHNYGELPEDGSLRPYEAMMILER